MTWRSRRPGDVGRSRCTRAVASETTCRSTSRPAHAHVTWVVTDGNAANATTEFSSDLDRLDEMVDWPLMTAARRLQPLITGLVHGGEHHGGAADLAVRVRKPYSRIDAPDPVQQATAYLIGLRGAHQRNVMAEPTCGAGPDADRRLP